MNVWDSFRESTFDKLAINYSVKYQEVENEDFDFNKTYGKTYNWKQMQELDLKNVEFDKKAKKTRPILYFILRTIPDFIENCLWFPEKAYREIRRFVKFRLMKRYDLVKLDLPYGWWDCDTRIFESIKTLLIEFVETEADQMYRICFEDSQELDKDKFYGLDYLKRMSNDPETPEESKQKYINLINAYIWFTKDRNQLIDRIDNEAFENVRTMVELEHQLYEKDTLNCVNVLTARELLWT